MTSPARLAALDQIDAAATHLRKILATTGHKITIGHHASIINSVLAQLGDTIDDACPCLQTQPLNPRWWSPIWPHDLWCATCWIDIQHLRPLACDHCHTHGPIHPARTVLTFDTDPPAGPVVAEISLCLACAQQVVATNAAHPPEKSRGVPGKKPGGQKNLGGGA